MLQPDALIVQDCTLLHQVDLFNGLQKGGFVLLNSSRTPGELGLESLVRGEKQYRISCLPATELALKHVGRPVPNAALLAGFAAATGVLKIESVVAAIRDKFPARIAEKNVAAALEAHGLALQAREAAHA